VQRVRQQLRGAEAHGAVARGQEVEQHVGERLGGLPRRRRRARLRRLGKDDGDEAHQALHAGRLLRSSSRSERR